MINAIRKAYEGYKAPSSEKARTVLLDECVRDMEKDLTPFKDTWHSQGLSIISDGLTNIKQKPLINVLAMNNRGFMFMYAKDFYGVEKTGKAIVEFFIQAIESIGPSNVLSVITTQPIANLRERKSKRDNSKLELLKIAKIHFASHYILLKRLNTCREALSTTIALNSWRDWAKKGDEHTRTIAQLVVYTIRDDDFWNEVENILKITKPIFLMVKFCDGEGPKMGKIYDKKDNMIKEIKDLMKESINASYFPQVEQILLKRWEKMNIPLHCLGFALSPRFYDTRFLETLAPGGIRKKAPNLDKEVVQGVMEAFSRIAENRDEERMLREQFATFYM
ncbi:uncharacterized protein LOC120135622 [Hibiscus syriacus]|uniref:uncharacterized protein LOC120135622 n=1 Tax=Hibiscus syriacus TaxID=106335 RepID=UPI0019211925|nr:uncharacterized protein LOC120135622 [Hibiscus syriacus]